MHASAHAAASAALERRERHVSGSPSLWAEVVAQALADACTPSERGVSGVPRGSAKLADRAEAWAFLTDEEGEWAEHRAWVAMQAGIDGEALRRYAMQLGRHPALGQCPRVDMR